MNPNTNITRAPVHSEPVHTRLHNGWSTDFSSKNNLWTVVESESPVPLEIESLNHSNNLHAAKNIQNLINRFLEEPQPQEKARYTLISILIHELEKAYTDHLNQSDKVFKYVDYNPVSYKDLDQYEFEDEIQTWLLEVIARIPQSCFDTRNDENNKALKAELLEAALWTNVFIPYEDTLFNALRDINPEKYQELSSLIIRGKPRDSILAPETNRFTKTKNARKS